MAAPRCIARLLLIATCGAACARGAADRPVQAASAAPSPAQPAGSPQAVVVRSRGKVELLHGGSGSWADAKVGDRLGAHDALRTEAGEADLAVEGVKVRLHESSRLELQSVGQRAMRTRVQGSVESEVDKSGRLDVGVENSDATAHSEGGHFFVTADGKGFIAVAAVTGSVHLSGSGQTVDIHKGEVSHIDSQRSGPSLPSAALRRVLLSVRWPNAPATNQSRMPVAGRVAPGSRVFVQGEPVAVESGGLFRTQVNLKEGKQKIAVVTVDALGRRKQVETVVMRDDSLPGARVKKKLWQWR